MRYATRFFALLAPCLLLCTGCSSPKAYVLAGATEGPEFVAVKIKATGPVEGRPTFGTPITIPSSNWLMFPFAMEAERGIFNFNPMEGVSGGKAYDSLVQTMTNMRVPFRNVNWHNVAFADPADGKTTLLFNRRLLITGFQVIQAQSSRPMGGGDIRLLFRVVETDTNGDGFLDTADATVAYITDAQGGNILRISPPDAQLLDVVCGADGAFWVTVRQDSDGDKRFTTRDTIQAYLVTRGTIQGYLVKEGELIPVPPLDAADRAGAVFK